MTDNETIRELSEIADTMECLGDLRKATVMRKALKLIKDNAADEFDVELAESMFSKRELAQLYVKKLRELEALKKGVKQ